MSGVLRVQGEGIGLACGNKVVRGIRLVVCMLVWGCAEGGVEDVFQGLLRLDSGES